MIIRSLALALSLVITFSPAAADEHDKAEKFCEKIEKGTLKKAYRAAAVPAKAAPHFQSILSTVEKSYYKDYPCVVKLKTQALRRTGRAVEAYDYSVKWWGLDIVADTHSSKNRALYDETALAGLDAGTIAVQEGNYDLAVVRLLNGRRASSNYTDLRKKLDTALADVYVIKGELLKAKGHYELAHEWDRAREMQRLWDGLKAQAAAKATTGN